MVLKITIFIRLYNILLIHNVANHSPIAVMFFQVFFLCVRKMVLIKINCDNHLSAGSSFFLNNSAGSFQESELLDMNTDISVAFMYSDT